MGLREPAARRRFNPRPPLPRGATARAHVASIIAEVVSILAPRCRGALRAITRLLTRRELFQSSPPVAEGRYFVTEMNAAIASVFQSSPPVAEGRYDRSMRHSRRPSLFQSSPPVAEGRYSRC